MSIRVVPLCQSSAVTHDLGDYSRLHPQLEGVTVRYRNAMFSIEGNSLVLSGHNQSYTGTCQVRCQQPNKLLFHIHWRRFIEKAKLSLNGFPLHSTTSHVERETAPPNQLGFHAAYIIGWRQTGICLYSCFISSSICLYLNCPNIVSLLEPGQSNFPFEMLVSYRICNICKSRRGAHRLSAFNLRN